MSAARVVGPDGATYVNDGHSIRTECVCGFASPAYGYETPDGHVTAEALAGDVYASHIRNGEHTVRTESLGAGRLLTRAEIIARVDEKGRYTLAELEALPTLAQGQADDLKVDASGIGRRVWLSRMTTADGAECDNAVTVESYSVRDGWQTIATYPARVTS